MYDDIVNAVSWSDVVSGILAIAALIAAVLVVKTGTHFILWMVNGRPYYRSKWTGRPTDTLPPGW